MATDRKPNILLLMTDQQRLSAASPYGDTPCLTPNLQRLANDGVRFETTYTSCPVCSPARASLITGLYPHAHGMCANIHELGCSVHELPDSPRLLSRQLEAAGYTCLYNGKWHLGTTCDTLFGAPNQPTRPKDVGFVEGVGTTDDYYQGSDYRRYLQSHGWKHELLEGTHKAPKAESYAQLSGPPESTLAYFLAGHAIRMLRETGTDTPFFMWHNFYGPHQPYLAPRAYYDLYKHVEIPEWKNFRWEGLRSNRPHQVRFHPRAEDLRWEDWSEAIRHYYALMTLIDEQIGRILDALEQSGQADNTIVICTSDHGDSLGSHGGLLNKGWNHFEEIQRIPLIIRFPKSYKQRIRPGRVIRELASLLDIYPTVLDAANADYNPEEIHGRSLFPLLTGRGTADWREECFVEFHGGLHLSTSMMTCRYRNLKYGWNCTNADELYNLENDPHERVNVIDRPDHAADVRAMRKRMEAFMVRTGYKGVGLFRQSRLGVWN